MMVTEIRINYRDEDGDRAWQGPVDHGDILQILYEYGVEVIELNKNEQNKRG